jgi:hypothetical protein
MGQKIVKVYNETSRPITISNWVFMDRSNINIEPNGYGELKGDQCAYTIIVKDGEEKLIKHGVYFPNIEWIIYYEDQKEMCHLLSGKGDVPLDLVNCYMLYEIEDEL